MEHVQRNRQIIGECNSNIANERKTSKKTMYEARTQGGQGWDLLELMSDKECRCNLYKSRFSIAFKIPTSFEEATPQKSISSIDSARLCVSKPCKLVSASLPAASANLDWKCKMSGNLSASFVHFSLHEMASSREATECNHNTQCNATTASSIAFPAPTNKEKSKQ